MNCGATAPVVWLLPGREGVGPEVGDSICSGTMSPENLNLNGVPLEKVVIPDNCQPFKDSPA